MANNDQWLFENMPRIRYSASGLIRDQGIKMIVGKTPFPPQTDRNYAYLNINFGTFFTIGTKPIVIVTFEAQGGSMHRSKVVIQGRGQSELDHTGFTAIVTGDSYKSLAAGWVHWQAVGF